MATPLPLSSSKIWALSADEALAVLQSGRKGLAEKEAAARARLFGSNDLSQKTERAGVAIFLSQLTNPLILLLVGAAVTAFFIGEKVDATVILAIVFLNAILGFFQEFKAEKTLRALKQYMTVRAKVTREGVRKTIDARELVPGDIVHLAIGDVIPADLRLVTVDDFTADEGPLTGESAPVMKTMDAISGEKSLPQDLPNMVFMGTSVGSGRALGVVTATRDATFFGKTADLLKQKAPESEFQKSMKHFGNFLLKITFIMTLFILVANAVLGKNFFDSLLFAIALAVGITPEVLPILMTITLSSGALALAKSRVVVKTLAAVEDLGNIDTLCCDKTGTLTEGSLLFKGATDAEGKTSQNALLAGMLCNASDTDPHAGEFSNMIDKALWMNTEAESLKARIRSFTVLDRNEFDFVRRRQGALVRGDGKTRLIVKGAPESIVAACILTQAEKNNIETRIARYENDGLRVIAVAEKPFETADSSKEDERDLHFLGFLLFEDPPKSDAKASLELLMRLGVRIKILSGDSAVITKRVCREVGLKTEHDRVMAGDELQKLSHREFERACRMYDVFVRVTPEQKYNIVATLNKEGHVVGFLGDGINDAPALKAADVGISVDTASEIAKEAADIILLEKNLKVLAEGIRGGRRIFANVTKYILNTVSANFGNMFTVAASSLFLKFLPLLPAQILLTNFVSDFPLLTIATDSVDESMLKRPRHWNIHLIRNFMVFFGLLSTVFDLILIVPLMFFFRTSPELFQTSWFIESTISEILITFSLRTKTAFWKSRPGRLLTFISCAAAALTIALPFLSFSRTLFAFSPVPATIFGFIALVLVGYFLTAELLKKFFFKKFPL